MAFVIIIGIVAGVLSFLPLWGGLWLSKRVTPTSNLGYASSLLLAVVGSMVILFGAAIICIVINRQDALPFVASEVGGLVVMALVFAIRKIISK